MSTKVSQTDDDPRWGDLQCSNCGEQTTYGEANLTQAENPCPEGRWPGDTKHDWEEV